MHVSIVLIRFEDLFWVHQRRDDKRVYPGLWGIGIGGKVENGEFPLQAAVRELQEESGLATPIHEILTFHWDAPECRYTGHVFETWAPSLNALIPCEREFADFSWLNQLGIEQKRMSGQLCPDTAHFWNLFLTTDASSR